MMGSLVLRTSVIQINKLSTTAVRTLPCDNIVLT